MTGESGDIKQRTGGRRAGECAETETVRFSISMSSLSSNAINSHQFSSSFCFPDPTCSAVMCSIDSVAIAVRL